MNIIFLTILISISSIICAPIDKKKEEPKIIRYEYKQLPNNGYHFVYELSDGQIRDEFATFEEVDGELLLRITGYYSYISSDNKTHTVEYTADENGYIAKEEVVDNEGDDNVTTEEPIGLSAAVIATLVG